MATRPPIRPPALKEAAAAKAAAEAAAPAAKKAPAPAPAPSGRPDFWDKIVNEIDIPTDQKAETKEALRKLAFFDSIHDFWKQRGNTKEVTDKDATEPTNISKERQKAVQENLEESIRGYVADEKGSPLASILMSETGNMISSPSDIENKVLTYFSKKYKPFNQQEQFMSVNQILNEWNDTSDWNSYSNDIKALPDSIQIMIDVPSIKSLEEKQRGTIGFFLLAFMDPYTQPGTNEKFLTFDMSPGNIGQIFTRFKQIFNAVFPQNVSDSANTSFNALLGRNKFFRADYSLSPTVTNTESSKKQVKKEVRSNAFTKDKYTLEFVDKDFKEKTPFAFYIEIKDRSGKVIGTIPFAQGQEQGPSVNYLVDIIVNRKTEGINPKGKDARLNKVTVFDRDLFFDIKRMGDQEQMLVTSAYGVTGDRFAGAFRRLLRRPGIYQSTKEFRVWRAPLNDKDTETKTQENRRDQIVEKLKIVTAILAKGGTLKDTYDQLIAMQTQVIQAGKTGYVRNKPIGKIIENLGNKAFIAENYTQIAATVVTYVMRLRMRDILEQIQTLIAQVEGIKGKIPEVVKAACVAGKFSPDPDMACPPVATLRDIPIKDALDRLDKFINENKALKETTVAFTITKNASGKRTKNKEPINVKLFDENQKLIKGSSSLLFNFAAAPFTHSEEGLGPVLAQLLYLSTSKRLDLADRKVNSLLVDYFNARDEIKQGFFNQEKKEQFEKFTDITAGLPPENVLTVNTDGSQGLMEAIKLIVQDGEARAAADEGVTVLAEAAAIREAEDKAQSEAVIPGAAQQGGAGEQKNPLQYRDIHDLFAGLCVDANHDLEIESDILTTLDDIELRWLTGVNSIRMSSLEDYGNLFEESVTTDLISYLLSKRTDQGGVLFDINRFESSRRDQRWVTSFDKMIADRVPELQLEKFILLILSAFSGRVIKEDPYTHDLTSRYTARDQWVNFFPGLLIALGTSVRNGVINLSPEAQKLLRGGGLEEGEEITVNVPDNATGSSRRRLYEGLRKRGGSGVHPEL